MSTFTEEYYLMKGQYYEKNVVRELAVAAKSKVPTMFSVTVVVPLRVDVC
jgi:hypothetical protein